MKDDVKNPSDAGKVESINDQLFASFDPDEEKSWLVGGSSTVNLNGSYNPAGPDAAGQWDWTF